MHSQRSHQKLTNTKGERSVSEVVGIRSQSDYDLASGVYVQ
jgi:hypothetical protein